MRDPGAIVIRPPGWTAGGGALGHCVQGCGSCLDQLIGQLLRPGVPDNRVEREHERLRRPAQLAETRQPRVARPA